MPSLVMMQIYTREEINTPARKAPAALDRQK